MKPGIEEYIHALKGSKRLGGQVTFHREFPAENPLFSDPPETWPDQLTDVMRANGIENLYRHQATAIELVRSGRHVVVATPTASGKTLVYNYTFLERFLGDSDTRALYIFPLKALAQDQLLNFNKTVSHLEGRKPTAAIYDGDTSSYKRKRIREQLPNVIMSNPEMLHLSFLPHHHNWKRFFEKLRMVVIDEVHTYRGVMGSHMAQVFRRLQRVCRYYGADPLFVFNSATVANPAELAAQLTGLPVATVLESGSPRGKRHTVFIDPLEGPARTAILLLQSALPRKLRTIVYTQSRKLTELIAIWAGSSAGEYADRISAYRAGFLPEERREIEAKLNSGELLAVISTSALELGIDIGDLDLCVLVGYPGTIVATLQRGGRVGRSGQASGMVMIAGEDALDQYFMRHPEDLLNREPEAAVINPDNPDILERHMLCAAAELPLKKDENLMTHAPAADAVSKLEERGKLLKSADGESWYSSRKSPQRHIDLRGSGNRFQIVGASDGEHRGEIDGFRAFKETHPGAIYLHRGETYLVDELDLETHTVRISPADVDYYTRVRAHKDTQIMEVYREKAVWGTTAAIGRLKVTEQVTGFERWRIRTQKRINRELLDLPEQTFETDGMWFEIPKRVQQAAEDGYMHFMGGIHAMEHAAIGMFPLLVMTDRNDLGGISIPLQPQLGKAAVFIYDGAPGGAGLCRRAFLRSQDLLAVTLRAIESCPCKNGCPSCVHSPKCGSGNRPIDKASAVFILERMKSVERQVKQTAVVEKAPEAAGQHEQGGAQTAMEPPPVDAGTKRFSPPTDRRSPRRRVKKADSGKRLKGKTGGRLRKRREARRKRQFVEETVDTDSDGAPRVKPWSPGHDPLSPEAAACSSARHEGRHRAEADDDSIPPRINTGSPAKADDKTGQTGATHYGVLDLETQRSAQEVGGWHRADLMKVSCGVLYDSAEDRYFEYLEEQLPDLFDHLGRLDCVIGFNIKRFDYKVLSGYTDFDFSTLTTLDILEEIHGHLGYRLSLDHLARVTLGAQKSADGLQALRWWKQGRIKELLKYCRQDVNLTWEIFRFGQENGYLLFNNKAGNTVRVPVAFGDRFEARTYQAG